MVVGQTELTAQATVDVPWWNFSESRVWNKVSEKKKYIYFDNFLLFPKCILAKVPKFSYPHLNFIMLSVMLVTCGFIRNLRAGEI